MSKLSFSTKKGSLQSSFWAYEASAQANILKGDYFEVEDLVRPGNINRFEGEVSFQHLAYDWA